VLNSPSIAGAVTVSSSTPDAPIACMVKQQDGVTYVFAVAMRDSATEATFSLGGPTVAEVEVLGENRAVGLAEGRFSDTFGGYDVHLYRVKP
jgi:hypothetical protein